MTRTDAVLVWDLDGTLYRSEEACRHYARGIAATLDADRRAAYLESLERYLSGAGGVEASDGWEAAVVLAGGPRGASRAYADAFARTREFMLGDGCALEVPEGLAPFLEEVAPVARRVLVSNTPAFGVVPLLERLELLPLLDEIVCGAAKPSGLSVRLRALADMYDLPTGSVLSIGDHFVNDIEPALRAGCATAYLDPFGVGPRGRATMEAGRFEELLDDVSSWVDGQAGRRGPLAAAG